MADQIKTRPAAAPVDPAADALTGTTVGRFVISQRLGAGGMGQVYGAEDTTLKRFVAIKRMSPRARSTKADRRRLLKEAQRASALNHPNLGSIYDIVEHAGELWVVMEYIEGIASNNPFPPRNSSLSLRSAAKACRPLTKKASFMAISSPKTSCSLLATG
jgi:serine/threonine protein kinase